ncbi:MAG: fibronectin type III domain-containing protein [Microthrixaceae bacterium]|nr:fibronectin type III domain-containing protein [Microthrixaceae bacterium]
MLSTRLRSTSRRREQGGYTMVELLVAMAASVIIIVPLTGVFIMSIRGTMFADDQLARTGDAQRIGDAWTNDVQNVSIGGVNGEGSYDSCPGDEAAAQVEQHLISFSWNQTSDALGAPRTATWVAVGIGDNMELIRRECEGGAVIKEQLLAMKVGKPGQTNVLDVVHGPETNGASPADFCPPTDRNAGNPGNPVYYSEKCTIMISGSFNYQLTVSRRVAEPSSGVEVSRAPDAPEINDGVGRNGYLTVAWTLLTPAADQPEIDQYRAFLYTDPNGSPLSTVLVDGASNSATFTSLTNGTVYYVRVQARNSVGWGPVSEPSDPITPQPTEPDAPTVPSVTPGDMQVTVNWSPNPNDGGSPVTEWRLWAVNGNGDEIGPVVVTPGSNHTGVIPGLINGQIYRVKVAGVNAIGEGLMSDFSEEVTPYGVPPAAGVVEAIANDAKVQLRWAPPADDNGRPIVGYVIREYKGLNATAPSNPSGLYVTNTQAGCTVTICQYDITAANGNYFRYTLASRSDVGDGTTIDGPESTLSVPMPAPAVQPKQPPHVRPSGAPSTPAAPTMTLTGSTIRVSFTLPADGGEPIERAFVYYQMKPTSSGGQWSTGWTSVDPNGFAVSGAQGDSKYVDIPGVPAGNYYRAAVTVANKGEWFSGVAGWRQSGQSGTSNELVVVSSPSTMAAPTATKGTSTTSGGFKFTANVSWSAPSDRGGACIKTYEVRFSNDASNVVKTVTVTGTPSGTPPSCSSEAQTSAAVGGIDPGVETRYFSVRAQNTGGIWSAWSPWGSTSALRQVCTITTKLADGGDDTFVSMWSRTTQYGSATEIKTAKDSVNTGWLTWKDWYEWTLLKFAPTVSPCIETGAAMPSSGVIYGGPTQTYGNTHGGGGTTNTGGAVTIEMYQKEYPSCSWTTDSNQKAGIWTAKTRTWVGSSVTWNSGRPDKDAYQDQVGGGQSNGYRWWAVGTATAVNQKNSATRFGYIVAYNDGNCGAAWKWRSAEDTNGTPPLMNTVFY